MENLLLLWLAAFPLMGSPGPATISLAGVGTSYGFTSGARYLGGIIAGTFGVLLMIATGITALILAAPALIKILTLIAALYIVYLAWKIATAPVGIKAPLVQIAPSFISGFALAIANPKAFVAIGAVYSGHTLSQSSVLADSVAKIAALTMVIIVVNTAWLVFGASFAKLLNNPTLGRIANITFALMLIASVTFVLISTGF